MPRRSSTTWMSNKPLSAAIPWAALSPNCSTLDYPRKVKKLILASSGTSHPGAHGIPLAMCRDMVRQGFEGYIREHTIETGWTKEFVAKNPDADREILASEDVRHRAVGELSALCAGAPEHDHTARLKEIKVPTLVLVGDDENHGASDNTHFAAAHQLAKALFPSTNSSCSAGEGHHYLATNPAAAHKAIREFIG